MPKPEPKKHPSSNGNRPANPPGPQPAPAAPPAPIRPATLATCLACRQTAAIKASGLCAPCDEQREAAASTYGLTTEEYLSCL